MLECCFTRFLPVLKQNARIIAIKIVVNKSNSRFTFEFGNSLDFECLLLHFDASTTRKLGKISVDLFIEAWLKKICEVGLEL